MTIRIFLHATSDEAFGFGAYGCLVTELLGFENEDVFIKIVECEPDERDRYILKALIKSLDYVLENWNPHEVKVFDEKGEVTRKFLGTEFAQGDLDEDWIRCLELKERCLKEGFKFSGMKVMMKKVKERRKDFKDQVEGFFKTMVSVGTKFDEGMVGATFETQHIDIE